MLSLFIINISKQRTFISSDKTLITEITELFLNDEDKRIRNRAYRLIEENSLSNLYDIVETKWVKYYDANAVPIILRYASKEFLLLYFKVLEQTGYERKLYRRLVELGELDFVLNYLYETDKLSYLYYCACNGINVKDEDIELTYNSYKDNEGLQKLLWSIGKLGRVDLLMDFCSGNKDS